MKVCLLAWLDYVLWMVSLMHLMEEEELVEELE
jgi:hypothetical protein